MPTPRKGPRLGGSPAHQKAILANLATSLFEHGAITTTETKARVLRPYAEKLITKAKRGDLHNRRQVMSVIRDKDVVHVLFTEIGPRFADRPGGYTRITKLGPRKGDNAPMAVIELVEEEYTPNASTTSSGTAAGTAPAAGESPAAEGTVAEGAADDTATEEPTAVEEPTGEGAPQVGAQDAVAEQTETDAPVAEEAAPDQGQADEAQSDEARADEAQADESASQDETK